jgi:hypothetical protein
VLTARKAMIEDINTTIPLPTLLLVAMPFLSSRTMMAVVVMSPTTQIAMMSAYTEADIAVTFPYKKTVLFSIFLL